MYYCDMCGGQISNDITQVHYDIELDVKMCDFCYEIYIVLVKPFENAKDKSFLELLDDYWYYNCRVCKQKPCETEKKLLALIDKL